MGSVFATVIRVDIGSVRSALGGGDPSLVPDRAWDELSERATEELRFRHKQCPDELETSEKALRVLIEKGLDPSWAGQEHPAAENIITALHTLLKSLGEYGDLEFGYLYSDEPPAVSELIFEGSTTDPLPIPVGESPMVCQHRPRGWASRIEATTPNRTFPAETRETLLQHLKTAESEDQILFIFYWSG